MHNGRFVVVLGLVITALFPTCGSADALPTTPEFMNAIAACGAGVGIRIDSDLKGSIESVYERDKTQGTANETVIAEIMEKIPLENRAASYPLYVSCITQLLSPKGQSALSALSEIHELSIYPHIGELKEHRTVEEVLVLYKEPERLFGILSRYSSNDIAMIPEFGKELASYKKSYYDFQEDQFNFEQQLLDTIGTLVPVRFRAAWYIYLNYYLMRDSNSEDQIKASGDFLNYSITWDDAERINTQLRNNTGIEQKRNRQFQQRVVVMNACKNILDTLR